MPINVAIIDENLNTLNTLKKTIDWSALECVVVGTANDGENGLALILEQKPDLVITDIRLPMMDGLNMIKEARVSISHCEYIIISEYDQFKYTKAAIMLGVSDYILKPFQNEELITACQRAASSIKNKRAKAAQQDQIAALKQRTQLSSLIINASHREQINEELLMDSAFLYDVYYMMAIRFSDEQVVTQKNAV